MLAKNKNQIIYTNEARCRDCYRCVRVCPVNAIKMNESQASVDMDKCIVCGTCIRECPQQAKSFRNDVYKVKKLLLENEKVAVSVAPSFAAIFSEWERKRIPSVFRHLGFFLPSTFCIIAETISVLLLSIETSIRFTPLVGRQACIPDGLRFWSD